MSNRLRHLFDLTGRVAVVTGASRGLGLQIAEALGEFGAKVALVSRKAADLDAATADFAAAGIECRSFAADLTRPDAAVTLVERITDAFGTIDVLVNNAGATWGAPAEDYPAAGWDKVFELNVGALFRLTQAVARAHFLPRGTGAIVNIASIEGLMGHHWSRPGSIAYNASKGAVVNLTRALAAEWGPRGVRVNAIAPGYFPSKMANAVIDAHGGELINHTPLGKLGNDGDLKGTALLFASDAGGHITGQILAIDGGFTTI
ncbi:SDR family oxidoreductase [Sphingomonas sp. CL5.1]|uniref:SDR family oxidoreductase n=1 Tax=Sphingomonas sp. CL5.1 TaxID=2653203 RepID=UPI0015830CC2|nr:SDR family oxidoreductase [Sphingomonas sp. CL5.1]QKR99322.1 SDR family oxidoreductase [Sphingomonas sp. CL5.1]